MFPKIFLSYWFFGSFENALGFIIAFPIEFEGTGS
jgi:hypothetical protein